LLNKNISYLYKKEIMINIYNVSIIGFLIGFIGDLLLNLMTQRLKILDAGLIDYFPTHGTFEAAFIAGGLVSFCVYVALLLWEKTMSKKVATINYGHTIIYLFVVGCIFDLFFRYLHIMPSLDKMYEKLSIPVSMFFAGGPMAASFIIASFMY
jgi:hypothetical protein